MTEQLVNNTLHSTHIKKRAMALKTLELSAGNVSEACKKANVSRTTFYRWYNKHDEFKDEVDAIKESLLDLAESKLLEMINDGNLTAIIFYLKTKGQSRGYIEKQYIESKEFREKDVLIVE